MSYKGYLGLPRIDHDAGVIRGVVMNVKDTITFQGKTVAEAEAAFRESVDDYLEFCRSLGEEPEEPFPGRMLVRVHPEVQRKLAMLARLRGESVDSLVSRELKRLTRRVLNDPV